ncbi:MAG: type VI secretion protein IcmF/TssM N-terminal domain-containing protein [Chthoniobacter sp.]
MAVVFALDPKLAGIIAFGCCSWGWATAKFIFFRAWLRKRKAQSMTSELSRQSSATPTAISDRPQIEKLDSLRKTFQSGLDKFKAAGKDLYKLPWYAVVGEPGAGKTEVIRHCDVGFPPGMQEEEFQGVGGTINMNWWFTNRAVILDTAGRLLFEKVPAGSTSEWKEFLKLLRKHRPNCPINGLLLAIPADSLVKDSEKKIEERAGWIARQLDTIQRELDIRFPVYIIITKCDLLNGFREFFEEVDNPEAQRQMLGWSNPEAIDKPFQPDLVVQHLYMVVARLREIRLGLLEDPVARDASHRRIDEVARPYAFPNSVSLIAENLRRYLSTIFVAGEWAAKPLFLRGIYFTSSLQEGSELDQELAQAVGMSVDELPSGGAWKRETTLFPARPFLEKIFREWGLVTRATNTRRLVRQRLLAILGTAAAALLLVGLFSWLGYQSMKDSIGRQSGYWLRASEGWAANDTWIPIVTEAEGHPVYHGSEPVGQGQRTRYQGSFRRAGQIAGQFPRHLADPRRRAAAYLSRVPPLLQVGGQLRCRTQARPAHRARRQCHQAAPGQHAPQNRRLRRGPERSGGGPRRRRFDRPHQDRGRHRERKQRQCGDRPGQPGHGAAVELCRWAARPITKPAMPEVIAWSYSPGNGSGKWPGDWMTGGGTLKQAGQTEKMAYNQAIDVGLEHFPWSTSARIARQIHHPQVAAEDDPGFH